MVRPAHHPRPLLALPGHQLCGSKRAFV